MTTVLCNLLWQRFGPGRGNSGSVDSAKEGTFQQKEGRVGVCRCIELCKEKDRGGSKKGSSRKYSKAPTCECVEGSFPRLEYLTCGGEVERNEGERQEEPHLEGLMGKISKRGGRELEKINFTEDASPPRKSLSLGSF